MNWGDILKRRITAQYANIIDEILSDGRARSARELLSDIVLYKNHPDYLGEYRMNRRSRAYIPTTREIATHLRVMASRGEYESVINPKTSKPYSPPIYIKGEEEG